MGYNVFGTRWFTFTQVFILWHMKIANQIFLGIIQTNKHIYTLYTLFIAFTESNIDAFSFFFNWKLKTYDSTYFLAHTQKYMFQEKIFKKFFLMW